MSAIAPDHKAALIVSLRLAAILCAMAWWNLRRTLHLLRWRASHSPWRRRFARSAGVWALIAMAATALYVGFISPNSHASVTGALHAFGQCRVNAYDCGDFTTRFEAQAVYWACGGRQNDVHRLDQDGDGWACEWNR
jgi:Excalibur calcium-binding domain